MQMYKVFIQNKPLFFIKKNKCSAFNGILISEKTALSKEKQVLELLQNSSLKLAVFSDDVSSCFHAFFKNYDWIEASGGIVRRKNHFLFIKRNNVWDLPKGKIDPNEKPKKAAIREIHEECGVLTDKIGKLIIKTYHVYEYNGKNILKKTYWYNLEYNGEAKLIPQTEEGITKVEWLKANQLKKVYKNTYLSVIDVLDKYFRN